MWTSPSDQLDAAMRATASARTARIELISSLRCDDALERHLGRVGRRVLRRLAGGVSGRGVVDLQRRLYAVDFGGYAEIGGDRWRRAGLSGGQGRFEERAEGHPHAPLALLDDAARGTAGVVVDTADGLVTSVARVRSSQGVASSATLRLWDYGVDLSSWDWSTLPDLR